MYPYSRSCTSVHVRRRACPLAGAARLSLIFALSLLPAFPVFAAGLPGEYLVTQRWRALNNSVSPLSNPANIAEENYFAVRAAIAPILQGAFTLSEFGVNVPLSLYHTAGFTMLLEGAGSVFQDEVDEHGRLVPNRALSLSNTNMLFAFSYAWHAWQRLIVGANVNFAYQTNFGDPLMGTGIDFGANYRLLRHPILGDHIVGLATQNLVAPVMGSHPFEFSSTAAYSRNLRLSAYSRFWESRIENHLEFDLKDFFASPDNFRSADGLKSLEWELNWRVGYWAMRMFKAYMIFGFDENVMGHWGLALGAQMPSFNQGRDLSFFYQYNMMLEQNSDASSHSFYLKADFGLHREEAWARRMARHAMLNPNDLYNRGRRLYAEGRYWDAFFIFSRLTVEFPDFFRNDWVQLLRASCQEKLDMRDQALANYNRVKERYPGAEVVAHADLGLMRVHYRNNDIQLATQQFTELNKPGVPDSLRHHGAYLMGQISLHNGELRRAIQTFMLIPEDHPEFIFARHSAAVTHAILGSELSEVLTVLEAAMSVAPGTQAAQEMVYRTYLMIGFIFYEEGLLSRAVAALRHIPASSYYAEDALLGQGWAALKARQGSDCITVGQQLLRTTRRPLLRCEGMLIQAYGHILNRDYARAVTLLDEAYALSRTLNIPSEDSLSVRRLQNEDDRITYSRMSNLVEEFALMGQTGHVSGILDSLRGRSNEYIAGFDDHARFLHEFQRNSFFTRTIEQVQEDIEFARATVQKLAGTGRDRGQHQRAVDQAREIDAELERLMRELEE
jgi:tetratricopeptide (TPR) repeat protein